MGTSFKAQLLFNVVPRLSVQEARGLLCWANRVADLSEGTKIDWADAWGDEDRADATAASVRRLEELEREEDWRG